MKFNEFEAGTVLERVPDPTHGTEWDRKWFVRTENYGVHVLVNLSTGELLDDHNVEGWEFIEFAPGVCGAGCNKTEKETA